MGAKGGQKGSKQGGQIISSKLKSDYWISGQYMVAKAGGMVWSFFRQYRSSFTIKYQNQHIILNGGWYKPGSLSEKDIVDL